MSENNSSRAQLIFNTSQSSCKGFNDYVSACEEFERLSFSNKPRLSYNGSIKATKASEEIFDSSNINEDIYTTVAEYQNTYNTSALTVTTNLSQSIENVMQYFEEDISISSPSSRSTPTNFHNIGKVATMVANLKRKNDEIQATEYNINQQPTFKRRESIKPNIKKLRALYDAETNEKMKNSPKAPIIMKTNIKRPNELKAPALIQAMKPKTVAIKPRASMPASPKITRKTKVKQIAQMFNAKISQLIHRNTAEVVNYTPLNNEYSPDPKQQLKTLKSTPPVAKPRKHIIGAKSTPPLPKPRTKLPTYRTGGGVRSPQPSPRLRRRNSLRNSDKTFFIVEDAFSQLSVKDKVLLYTKFINDMNQQNQQLTKTNSESFESNIKKQLANGEVINEKQATVKHLTEELEAKCNFPKQTVSPKALLRMQSIIDATEVDKQNRDTQTSMYMEDKNNIYRAECAQVVEDIKDENPLHVSTLTVVLKASPKVETIRLTKSAERPKALSSKQRRLIQLSLMEPSFKRSNESIRSIHLSSDPCAPPKKIRRTRSEQLNPLHFFQDSKVKKQFFEWIEERHGVDFAITLSDGEQKSVPTEAVNSATANISEITQKSDVERLLEDAMNKLTNTHISTCEFKGTEMLNNIVDEETQNSAPSSITPRLSKQQRKSKRKAPLPPIAVEKQIKPNCDSGISTFKKKLQTEQIASSGAASSIGSTESQPLSSSGESATGIIQNQAITSNVANTTGSSILSSIKQLNTKRDSGESGESGESAKSGESVESGVSYLPKSTSDDSQTTQRIEHKNTEFEFVKPQKPPRRKKMRHTTSDIIESNVGDAISTTTTIDSDWEQIIENYPTTPTSMESKQQSSNIKKFCLKTLKAMPLLRKSITPKKSKSLGANNNSKLSSKELNRKIMQALNSPRRIKLAYNLTFLTSTSPNTDSDKGENNEHEISPRPNRDSSHSLPLNTQQSAADIKNNDDTISLNTNLRALQRPLSDSFVDQGFETATNSVESPIRLKRHNCLIEFGDQATLPSQESFTLSRFTLKNYPSQKLNQTENPSNFSTPVKGHKQKSFISPAVVQQQNFSPISTPLKSRRPESRCSSVAMQAIPEDHVYDAKCTPISTPDTLNASENAFFANAPTLDMSSNAIDFDMEKHSTFWIKIDNLTISLDIKYYTVETIRLFYLNFGQKYTNRLDLHFGIDNSKFSFFNPNGSPIYHSQREPPPKNFSHYWFSTADLAIPFNGNFMPTKEVLRFFKFVRSSIKSHSVIRCGVDSIEFTCPISDRYSNNTTKFSMESNYSMLIGLQSGNSNGLEGRSHFAWPNPLCNMLNANNVQITDLDQSEFDSFSLTSSDFRRSTNSPFSITTKMSSSQNTTPRTSPEFNDAQLTDQEAQISQIYKDAQTFNLRKSEIDNMPHRRSLTVPQLLEAINIKLQKLKSFEEQINLYIQENNTCENFKETSAHLQKLRNIIEIIENIGRDNGFKKCSPQQLESFLFFLNRYADLTLTKFTDNFDTILAELHQQLPVLV